MKLGTKSLLFGVHQFAWHPITVWLAYRRLYGRKPSFRESVCILVHDWGYWGCSTMDGQDGINHPFAGARIVSVLFDRADSTTWFDFCVRHSRTLSQRRMVTPSRLCWADKCSMMHDPWWFYAFRARLTGELAEYRENAARSGFLPSCYPDRMWHTKLVKHLDEMAQEVARGAGR